MKRVKSFVSHVGLPRIIIVAFLLLIIVIAILQGQDMKTLAKDSLVRLGMNGVLGLAMVPTVMSGVGLNFGLPVGILGGILGGLISIELGFTGVWGFVAALLFAIPLGVVFGWMYGWLNNRVKGSEMLVGTYVGYAAVSIMCIAWLVLPFHSPNMIWPIAGEGLRNTIALDGIYGGILNDALSFEIFGVVIPTGLLLAFAVMCLLVWLFMRSKTGVAMSAAGDNPRFAQAAGISVNRARMTGTILSTVLGAIGIVIYAQSFGFYQLYTAPLNMAFPAVAAVLLGGASTNSIRISHVVVGTLLFQTLLTTALPVANQLLPDSGLSEIIRIVVSNGIILYALTQAGGEKK